MRALIYCRVSVDRGGRSLEEQEAECRAWAAREGWDVEQVVSETGSASRYARSTQARSRWDELIAAVTSGRIQILLTWEASRATRQLAEYAELADLCAKHHVLWGYSGTLHDLSTRDARFRTGLDALLAQDESARTSERILRSTRARAAAGRPHGKLPYGYRREYDPQSGALLRQVPDEDQAPIVREIVERVLDGETLYAIAADLTARGVPIPRPARNRVRPDAWLTTTVRRIATTPTVAGLRLHQGQVVGEADWPAIITREEHERVTQILDDPSRWTRTGDSTAKHLLSGIARCGLCGGPVRYLKHKKRQPSYSCSVCYRIGRGAARLDEHVTKTVLALLEGIDVTAVTAASPELQAARDELAALERRLDGFTTAAADGEVSPAALAKIEARLGPQITAARAKVRAHTAPAGVTTDAIADPHTWWDEATLEQQRALIRAVVTITLHPSPATKTFRPEYVEITPTW